MTTRLKPTAGVRCASGLMLRLPQTDSAVMQSLETLYAAWERPFVRVSPPVDGSGEKSPTRSRAFHDGNVRAVSPPRTEIAADNLSAGKSLLTEVAQ